MIHKVLILLSIILKTQAQISLISNFYIPELYLPSFQLPNTNGRQYHKLPLGLGTVGAESTAFDCEGNGPYVGVSDGRILKWEGSSIGWTVFAITSKDRSNACDGINNSPLEQFCGRPLGLRFNMATCELYIADSSFGLVKVHRDGGAATPLATSADGIPFRFVNALDIDSQTGDIYFTDSSSQYHRWEFRKIDVNDRSGRLMKYNTKMKSVTVLVKGLSFPNGVALSKNKDFILVAETTLYQVQRYWLTGPKAGVIEVFMKLTGYPDNINRNAYGDFWIAQNPTKPIKVNEVGIILESLDTNDIITASDIIEFNNTLWIGSVFQNYIIFTQNKATEVPATL